MLLLFTHIAPYLVFAMYLPRLSLKQNFITSLIASLNLLYGALVYIVGKSKVEIEKALFGLISLLIVTQLLFWISDNFLIPETKKSLV